MPRNLFNNIILYKNEESMEYKAVTKYLFARRQQMEQFARELFRVERTISLVDNGSSGKPKIRREEGIEAKMVRGMAVVLVGRCYQLHYYPNVFFPDPLGSTSSKQTNSKQDRDKERDLAWDNDLS